MARSCGAGAGQYFQVGDSAQLSLGDNNKTILGWFYPTSNSGNLLQKYDGGGSDVEYRIKGDGAGHAYVDWHDVGTNYHVQTSTTSWTLNAWNLVGFTWDAANKTMTFRLNEEDTVGSYVGAVPVDLAQQFIIGDAANALNFCELMVWDRVLSRQERDYLWNGGRGMCMFSLLFGGGFAPYRFARGHGAMLGKRRDRITGIIV